MEDCMVHDRDQKLLDSRAASRLEQLRRNQIDAAEAWWQSLTEEQRTVYAGARAR
jgi:hypothetical protein